MKGLKEQESKQEVMNVVNGRKSLKEASISQANRFRLTHWGFLNMFYCRNKRVGMLGSNSIKNVFAFSVK